MIVTLSHSIELGLKTMIIAACGINPCFYTFQRFNLNKDFCHIMSLCFFLYSCVTCRPRSTRSTHRIFDPGSANLGRITHISAGLEPLASGTFQCISIFSKLRLSQMGSSRTSLPGRRIQYNRNMSWNRCRTRSLRRSTYTAIL